MKGIGYYIRIPGCFLVLLIIFIGCRRSSGKEGYFDAKEDGVQLCATVLTVDSLAGSSACCMIIGDKLIFYLAGEEYSYAVYKIRGDSLIYGGKFMRRGNGPYEMQIPRLKYRPDKNELILYSADPSKNDFYLIHLDNFNHLYETRCWKAMKLPALPSRGCLEFVNDSTYLHSSYTQQNSLFSLACKGANESFINLNFRYPDDRNNADLLLMRSLFKGELVKHPRKSSFIYSSDYFKYIILFDLENKNITNIRYISAELPDYKRISDPYRMFALNGKVQDGCKTVIATEKYIYIGYNNLTWEDINKQVQFKGYPNSYFDRINVFDWEGNYISGFVLDKPVDFFVVGNDNNYIYASSLDLTQEHQPDQVLRFELKGL